MRQRLVVGYAGVLIAGALAEIGYVIATRNAPVEAAWGFRATWAVWVLMIAPVGTLLALRVPRNPIGWVFLASAGVDLVQQFVFDVLLNELGGSARVVALWLGSWLWIPAGAVLLFALLLFPTGRPKSRAWAAVTWLFVVTCIAVVAAFAFGEPTIELSESLRVVNPFLVVALPSALVVGLEIALQVVFLLAIGSLIARRIGADDVVKHQLRWVAYTFTLVAGLGMVFGLGEALGLVDGAAARVGTLLLAAGIPMMPVAIGVAVLRYRLYDIDRIISRTVAYSAVTLGLALFYFGVVLTLQRALRPVTGGRSVAVAVSTLVVFAAFRPAVRFVRELVDRRFNRTQYDAQRTVEAFAARLREQIELDALVGEMKDVAVRTMQPAHVGVWLPRS